MPRQTIPVPAGAITPHPGPVTPTLGRAYFTATVTTDGLRLLEQARTVILEALLVDLGHALADDDRATIDELHANVQRLVWFWASDTRGRARIDIARAVCDQEGAVTLTNAALLPLLNHIGRHRELVEIDDALNADPDADTALVAA